MNPPFRESRHSTARTLVTLADTTRPSTGLIIYAVASSLVVLVVGLGLFSRMERQFADVI